MLSSRLQLTNQSRHNWNCQHADLHGSDQKDGKDSEESYQLHSLVFHFGSTGQNL